MSNNKEFWERVKKTDPKRVKAITGKQYKGNSPQPYYLVERMTDEFGMCGIGWGLNILNERMERLTETDVLHVAVVELWYVLDGKQGSITQIGQTKAAYKTKDGGMLVDEDAPKKSITDAMTKCMSYLGFAGDIFSGQWDDSKYVQELTKEFEAPEKKSRLPALTDDEAEDAYNAWMAEKERITAQHEDGIVDPSVFNEAWFKRPSNVRTAITRWGNTIKQLQEAEKQAAQHIAEIAAH